MREQLGMIGEQERERSRRSISERVFAPYHRRSANGARSAQHPPLSRLLHYHIDLLSIANCHSVLASEIKAEFAEEERGMHFPPYRSGGGNKNHNDAVYCIGQTGRLDFCNKD